VFAASCILDTAGTLCAVAPINDLHSYTDGVQDLRALINPYPTNVEHRVSS